MGSLRLAAMVAAAVLLMPRLGGAQQHKDMPGMGVDEIKSAAPYRPGLGDLMTAFIQPRHTKLGLAGAAGNWAYAAYELGELREAFEEAGKLVPKHGKLAIPPAIAATVTPALAALGEAIAAKDAGKFMASYGQLTAACNACHQSADHPMIVIQVPTASPFPDQDFRAPQ